MKKTFIRIITVVCLLASAFHGKAANDELIPRPLPPDTLLNLQPRCDFIINRFWDRCNFEQAFLHPKELNAAFGEWILIMPHASADTVHASVDKLIAKFAKSGPNTLKIAEMAENWLYSDTAQFRSEEVYLPFAKAAATHKKISKAEKARFAQQAQIIESSGLGKRVPDLKFTRPDGSKGSLADASGSSVLIFINDPDCSDCNLARVRLSADFNTNQLLKEGELTIVSLYPGEPDSKEWQEAAASYPETWIVGAMPDADLYFDLRESPTFIFLNKDHKVLAKYMPVDHYLNAFRIVNSQTSRRK